MGLRCVNGNREECTNTDVTSTQAGALQLQMLWVLPHPHFQRKMIQPPTQTLFPEVVTDETKLSSPYMKTYWSS